MEKGANEKLFLVQMGVRLRMIREDRNLTLEQAEELGWPAWRHLQKIESGKNITVVTLLRLAKFYNVGLREIIGDIT